MDENVFDNQANLEISGTKPIDFIKFNEGLDLIKKALIMIITKDYPEDIPIVKSIEEASESLRNTSLEEHPNVCSLGNINNYKVIRMANNSWNYCHVFMNRCISKVYSLDEELRELLPMTFPEIIEFVDDLTDVNFMLEMLYGLSIHLVMLEINNSKEFVLTYDDINHVNIDDIIKDHNNIHRNMTYLASIMKKYLEDTGYRNYLTVIGFILEGKQPSKPLSGFPLKLFNTFNYSSEIKTITHKLDDDKEWTSWHYENVKFIGYVCEVFSWIESINKDKKFDEANHVTYTYIKPTNVQILLTRLLVIHAHIANVQREKCTYAWQF